MGRTALEYRKYRRMNLTSISCGETGASDCGATKLDSDQWPAPAPAPADDPAPAPAPSKAEDDEVAAAAS
jgi:hypothetical protein